MADPLTWAALGLGATALGTGVGAAGTIMAGDAEADALHSTRFNRLLTAKNKADELRMAGNTALASSQRDAMEYSRNKDMLLSKARAAAGASGGGVTDTSVLKTMGGIEQQGEFQKAMSLFGGMDRKAGLDYEASNVWNQAVMDDQATQYQAAARRRKARWDAAGTILSGAGSAFSQFG